MEEGRVDGAQGAVSRGGQLRGRVRGEIVGADLVPPYFLGRFLLELARVARLPSGPVHVDLALCGVSLPAPTDGVAPLLADPLVLRGGDEAPGFGDVGGAACALLEVALLDRLERGQQRLRVVVWI